MSIFVVVYNQNVTIMAKTTKNRTNKNTNTVSQQKARANSAINGKGGRISSYTGGAQTAKSFTEKSAPEIGFPGYTLSEEEGMRRAWQGAKSVPTYTRSKNGLMSVDGSSAGGSTWTYTNRDMEGNFVSQSGRNKIASRSQRNYDTRAGMNNISPRVVQKWLETGIARQVDGSMVGPSDMVIRQKADGSYTMGLSNG